MPETTVTVLGPAGGFARSADGLFEVRVDPGQLDGEERIEIATRRDLAYPGQESLIYAVTPQTPALVLGHGLSLHQALAPVDRKLVLTRVRDGAHQALSGSIEDRAAATLSVHTRDQLAGNYVLFYAPVCQSIACGGACEDGGASGFCDQDGRCVQPLPFCDTGREPSGWDDLPGTGMMFIVNSLSLAPQGVGFDLDGACNGSICIDNKLASLPVAGAFNPVILQRIEGGGLLLLVELAGLNDPYEGVDPSLTVKLYPAYDRDVPAYPDNNFRVPPGQTDCCAFTIDPAGVAGVPLQARARTPSRVQAAQLTSLSPVSAQVPGILLLSLSPMRLDRARISAHLPTSLRELTEGLLGGVLPVSDLVLQTGSSSSDVLARYGEASALHPDIDVDGDGLEQIIDTDGDGTIDQCLDGCIGACAEPQVVPPIADLEPGSCAFSPRMADGFSAAFSFTALGATVHGVGP